VSTPEKPAKQLEILPFRGFAGADRVCVLGQVMKGVTKRLELTSDSGLRKRGLPKRLARAWHLLISPTVRQAWVRVTFGGQQQITETDRHGFFFTCFEAEPDDGDAVWQPFDAQLLSPSPGSATGEVLVAPPSAQRLVVSDIDDTVVYTGVTRKLRMLWTLFTKGSHSRIPFPGIGALYRGLHAGPAGDEGNPLIYVSRSPWSIYPVLEEFFERNNIPMGPLLLREWGITWRHPYPRLARQHKRDMVEQVLQVYRELPVILIGDSGQHDPELYSEFVHHYPGRIEAVYIRDLAPGGERSQAIRKLAGDLQTTHTELVIAHNSLEMAQDAARRGWLPEGVVEEVEREMAQDSD
jgi:phosphatidate phosphatase APP1